MLQHETLGGDGRRRPVSLAAVARPAGWDDIVGRVAAALRQRRHVILAQALGLDSAVGTAISVGDLDREPLLAREGGRQAELASISALLVLSLAISNLFGMSGSPISDHLSVAVSVQFPPSSSVGEPLYSMSAIIAAAVDSLLLAVRSMVLLTALPFLFLVALGVSAQHLLTFRWMRLRPGQLSRRPRFGIALLLQLPSSITVSQPSSLKFLRIGSVPPRLIAGIAQTTAGVRHWPATALRTGNQLFPSHAWSSL